eukprot:jgi/Mesen1/8145/ME000438S07255
MQVAAPDAPARAHDEGARTFSQDLHNGVPLDLGNYYVDLYIGSPPQRQVAVWDTGSDLLSPEPPTCRHNASATCPYSYSYGSGTTRGQLAHDTFTLANWIPRGPGGTPGGSKAVSKNKAGSKPGHKSKSGGKAGGRKEGDVEGVTKGLGRGLTTEVPGVLFGIGTNQEGDFVYADGILGMGRSNLSFAGQISRLCNDVFSSCLVERAVSPGRPSQIVYGAAGVPATGVAYTPLLINPADAVHAFYYVQVVGVSVGDNVILVPPHAWALDITHGGGGTIFDSGTTFGTLHVDAWVAIFRAVVDFSPLDYVGTHGGVFNPCFTGGDIMHNYPRKAVPSWGKFFPDLTLHLKGGTDVILQPCQYMFEYGEAIVCAALQPVDPHPGQPNNILGGIVQQNKLLVWDRKNGRLGFKPMDCTTGQPL